MSNCLAIANFHDERATLLLSMCCDYRTLDTSSRIVSGIVLYIGIEISRQIMTRAALQVFFLLIFYLMRQTMSSCEGPYLNLCGYYENDLNTSEIEDFAETICDCQEMRFCFLVEFSPECESTIVILSTNRNFSLSNLYCDILPLKSGIKTPAYELLNKTESGIFIKIITDSNSGRYKINCSVFEIVKEFNTTINSNWEIVSVDPMEVTIDSEIKLQLTVVKQTENSPSVWCFVKTPDNSTEVFSAFWISDTQINCTGFKPVIPGIFQVSLHSIMNKFINVKVISKHPNAERAEYSLDFETIFIYFDENIELHSSCANVFHKGCLESFGRDFDCFIRGNALVVKMGTAFQIVNNVSISSENNICRASSFSSEFCLSAPSANLVLLKPKLLGPILSLHTNPTCGISSEKYLNVQLIPPKHSNYITLQNQTLQSGSSGKTQRKNLIRWRTIRKIQSKFSSSLIIPQTNTTREVLSLLENLPSLDEFDVGQNSLGSASVSIFVQSSPSSSCIMAEANVTFCEEPVKLFRYRWIVNREDVFEDGKVLIVEDLPSGKYVIKCLVIGYNSSEVFGEGWAITEILPTTQKVLIIPSEITVGTTEGIFLHAVIWPGNSISWTCKTIFGKLCTTTDNKLASDVVDLTSPNISIPARTFPVGDYVWSVENAQGANTAKVFIKSGSRAAVGVEFPVFVKPSEKVLLRGSVKRAQGDCEVWWTSVREKGFSYLNLNNMRQKEEISIGKSFQVEEIDLVIPPSSDSWRGVESDSLYMFKLQVFCPQSTNNPNGSLDYVKVPLSVLNPPRVSPLVVEPLEGFSMITHFLVSGGESDVSDSLVFEWSYVDTCDTETPIKRGIYNRSFTTYLPPGDIKLQLKVCSDRGICSTTSTPTINVIQDSEFPAENFQYGETRSRIEFLISSGDTLEALGLATTAFKSLALVPEAEFREMIFSTVEEGIKAKIEDLTRRMKSDSKAAKLSLEFFEQAITVAKYFRKGSDILVQLIEFKDRILKIIKSKKLKRSF